MQTMRPVRILAKRLPKAGPPNGARRGPVLLTAAVAAATLAGIGLFLHQAPAAGQGANLTTLLRVELNGALQSPAVLTPARGEAYFELEPESRQLHYRVTVRSMDPVAQARIHMGLPGENGPVEVWLFDRDGTMGPGGDFRPGVPLRGSVELTITQTLALNTGALYVNITTAAHPQGEIRGQFASARFPLRFEAELAGSTHSPPVDSPATGRFRLEYVPLTGLMNYTLVANNLADATAAHIHVGAPGETGGVVAWLYDRNGVNAPGGDFGAGQVIAGALDFDRPPGFILGLLAGEYYVNVHTETHPSGEIRGNLAPGGVAVIERLAAFAVDLSGDDHIPPVQTDAYGGGTLVLDSEEMRLYYHLWTRELEAPVAAVIHSGSAIENGPELVWIYDVAGRMAPGGNLGAETGLTGSVELTVSEFAAITAGMVYVNVRTVDNPEGELRGQPVAMTRPIGYEFALSGEAEVPPVSTGASGQAAVSVLPASGRTTVRIAVADIGPITMCHIHRGRAGTSGPPLVWLYDRTGANAPGGDFDEANPLEVDVDLSGELLLALLAGELYINVHTEAHPGGELRGQIATNGGGVPTPTPPPPQRTDILKAELTGDALVPPVDTDAGAESHLVLDEANATLHFGVRVWNLADITAVRLFAGPPGDVGQPFLWLYDVADQNAPGGPFDADTPLFGSVTVSVVHMAALKAGGIYMTIHTDLFAGGEVRGQIGPHAPPAWEIELDGASEVPAVVTGATGHGRFELTGATDLDFELEVADISGITAAHLHTGWPGENGPPAVWLYDSQGVNAPGGPFGPGDPFDGTVEMGPGHTVRLLMGGMYVNVHTESHPAGEIRGQVARDDAPRPEYAVAAVLRADLDGDQEVPPVTTNASGSAVLVLETMSTGPASGADARLTYRIVVDDLDGATMAHLHTGGPGEIGPPVVWLYDSEGTRAPGGAFNAAAPLSGAVMISATVAAELLAGGLYVNVHTAEHPGGEIRGQALITTPLRNFEIDLTGAAEVPPVSTQARGTFKFALGTALDRGTYELAVTDLQSPTMAHIHRGRADANGPPIVWLYDVRGLEGPGGQFGAANPLRGGLRLRAEFLADLYAGLLYVNVHTVQNPQGEIRGQLDPSAEPRQWRIFIPDTSVTR